MALAAFSCFLASAAASVDALAAAFSAGVCFPDPDPEPEPESEPESEPALDPEDWICRLGLAKPWSVAALPGFGLVDPPEPATRTMPTTRTATMPMVPAAAARACLPGTGASPTSHNIHCLSACAQLFIELPLYGGIGIRQLGPMTRTRPLRW